MIEREEKDGVWDEKKKAFGVFIFYAKKKKIKMWKNDKRSSKKKVWVKKIFEESQAKGVFNLMVQQLSLEDRENCFWWVQERPL